MKTNSQQLNRRLTFERQPVAADSFTGQEWEQVTEVWGSVKPTSSRESMAADAMQASLTHTVMVRWVPVLVDLKNAEWRIRYAAHSVPHTLAIVGPGREVDGRWIIFDCVEGLADGH